MSEPFTLEWDGTWFTMRSDVRAKQFLNRLCYHAPDPLKFERTIRRYLWFGDNKDGHAVIYGVFYAPKNHFQFPVKPTIGFTDLSPKTITNPDVTAKLLLLHSVTGRAS